MPSSGSGRTDGYTLERAVNDVFGRMPLWPASACVLIVMGGIVAAGSADRLRSVAPLHESALRWGACAAYGIVVVALLLTVPRMARLVRLARSLGRRPANDGGDDPWWPLRLLAAALHPAPAGPRTPEAFIAATGRVVAYARSMLAYRLWPSCVAAFVAPALGLLSAWEAGRQVVLGGGGQTPDIFMQLVPQVSPPMVATIGVGLGLMLVLAIVDLATKSLLLRWGTTMTLADAETVACRRLLRGHGGDARRDDGRDGGDRRVASSPATAAAARSHTGPGARAPADDLQRLLEEFPKGG